MAKIEFSIEDKQWQKVKFVSLVKVSCESTFKYLGIDNRFHISVLGCNNKRISELNLMFRKLKEPTNILSWPSKERSSGKAGLFPDIPIFDHSSDNDLGDLALAYSYCMKEANGLRRLLSDHLMHLTVHGVLHLLGFDHLSDQDARIMEQVETNILNTLGLEDPYK